MPVSIHARLNFRAAHDKKAPGFPQGRLPSAGDVFPGFFDPSAENAQQRERRVSSYNRNGIFDIGCKFTDWGETYSVMTSDVEGFDAKEFESPLRSFSLGTYRKYVE